MGLSTQTEVITTPILHVEARVKNAVDNVIIRTDVVSIRHRYSVLTFPS